jgi:hypothetical protein
VMIATTDPRAGSPTSLFIMDKMRTMANVCAIFNLGVQASTNRWCWWCWW